MKVLGGSKSARRNAALTPLPPHTYKWGDNTIPQVRYLGQSTIPTDGTSTLMLTCHTISVKSGTSAAAANDKVLTQVPCPPVPPFTKEVQPVVMYAAEVWSQPTQSLRKKIDSWQMGLVTRALHCHAKTSRICIQQELGLLPLHATCGTLTIRYKHCH